MRRSFFAWWLAVAIAMPIGAAAIADPPVETTQPAVDIEALVAQLNDPDPAKAASAREKLVTLGEAAQPALERFTKSRTAAESVLATIEMNRVAAPTLITLKLNDASVEDVMAAFSKQTGYLLRPYNRAIWNGRANKQTVSVDYQNTPFWDALIDFCQKAQLSPYFNDSTSRQMLFMPSNQMGQSMFNSPRSASGAMLTLMTQLSRQSSISLGTQQSGGRSQFTGRMILLSEPKVRVTGFYYQAALDEAVDDNGNNLLPAGEHSFGGMNTTSRQSQVNVAINLLYPANKPGLKIARLRGKLKMKVATTIESVEFQDVSGDKEQPGKTESGRRITICSAKPLNEGNDKGNLRQYLVKVIVYRDKLEARKFTEMTNNLGLRVMDAQGRDLQFQMNREVTNKGNETHISMMYYRRSADEGGGDDVGEPAKIVWDVILDSKEITVPFEFKDLPMP